MLVCIQIIEPLDWSSSGADKKNTCLEKQLASAWFEMFFIHDRHRYIKTKKCSKVYYFIIIIAACCNIDEK